MVEPHRTVINTTQVGSLIHTVAHFACAVLDDTKHFCNWNGYNCIIVFYNAVAVGFKECLPLGQNTSSKAGEDVQSQLDYETREILYDDSEQLCIEFSKFVTRTGNRLRQKVSAKDLSTFVLTTLNCLRMEYPANLTDKLNTCEEVGEVLCELTCKECDIIVFHDIDFLEIIIQNYFGEADEDLRRYNMELEKYLRRRICEHHLFQPDIVGDEVTTVSKNAKLYIFMDSTWTKDMSSRKMHKLKKKLATVLQSRKIRLTEVRVGSLYLCYSILEKDFTHTELQIEQILSLINIGVKVLFEEISGCKYSNQMEKTCKYDCASPPQLVLFLFCAISKVDCN